MADHGEHGDHGEDFLDRLGWFGNDLWRDGRALGASPENAGALWVQGVQVGILAAQRHPEWAQAVLCADPQLDQEVMRLLVELIVRGHPVEVTS